MFRIPQEDKSRSRSHSGSVGAECGQITIRASDEKITRAQCRGSLVRKGGSLESYWRPAPREFKSPPRRMYWRFFNLLPFQGRNGRFSYPEQIALGFTDRIPGTSRIPVSSLFPAGKEEPVTFAVHSFTVISRKIIPALKSEIFPPLRESISVPSASPSTFPVFSFGGLCIGHLCKAGSESLLFFRPAQMIPDMREINGYLSYFLLCRKPIFWKFIAPLAPAQPPLGAGAHAMPRIYMYRKFH
jgi:hypothetical protein